MSKKSLAPINIMAVSAAPTIPTLRAGDIYYDTGTTRLRQYSGSAWSDVSSVTSVAGRTGVVTLTAADVGAGTFPSGIYGSVVAASGAASTNGTGVTVSRSDHDHGCSLDSAVVHQANTETVTGEKDFTGGMTLTSNAANNVVRSTTANQRIEAGTTTITLSGVSQQTKAITFATAFSATPVVLVGTQSTNSGGLDFFGGVYNTTPPTSSGFTAWVEFGNRATGSATVTIFWIAIGPA